MSSRIEVVSVNLSAQRGMGKQPASQIALDGYGVVGDAHATPGPLQVSLLAQETLERFTARTGQHIQPGQCGENITFLGLACADVAPLDRFRWGEVELEVTRIGKPCQRPACPGWQGSGERLMATEGIFARVVSGGTIRPGDCGDHFARKLRVLVITLSDRAAAGQYTDRAGPRVRELVEQFLAGTRWRPQIDSLLLPDDADRLRNQLINAIETEVDVVFTTGGTGVGPRDITPETAAAVCDKLIPGIMEHIRLKSASESPNALLSRAIAGVAGATQIYTLPGSVRAVEQYLAEILKILEHAIYMVHGIDVH